MAFAKELWDRKIIQDPQMFTKIADLPDQDDLLEGINSDAAKAQRENRDLAVGRVRVPREFDNHAEHIKRHNEFRKSLRYETMPQDWQDLVDKHLDAHETLAAEEAGKQVAKQNVHGALPGLPTANEAPAIPGQMMPGMPGDQPPMSPPGGMAGPEAMAPPGMVTPSGMPDAATLLAPDESGPVPS